MIESTDTRIRLLRSEIELEESNYRYALELKKDYKTVSGLRNKLKTLKNILRHLTEKKANEQYLL